MAKKSEIAYEHKSLEEILKNLRSMGMSTFVDYYDDFKLIKGEKNLKSKLAKDEKKWKEESINTKVSVGRRIFSEGKEKKALELVLSANQLSKATMDKAVQIYQKEYPNSELKQIRFVRPEFEFGQTIVENLFEGYEIISQYSVGEYKVDWYIPELKLVIEFDEKHHKRQKDFDIKRQKFIEKKLKCKFLRYTF